MVIDKLVPFPPDSGGKQRTLAVVKAWLGAGAEVVLFAQDDGTGHADELRALGVDVRTVPRSGGVLHMLRWFPKFGSLIMTRFWSTELHAEALEEARARPVDVLQVEYLQNTVYGDVPARVKVADLHDAVSEQTARIAGLKRWPLRAVFSFEARRAAAHERRVLSNFDVVVCVSQRDADTMGLNGAVVAGNGWPAVEDLQRPTRPVVLFAGNFAFSTNADAAVWMVDKIWPAVLSDVPDAELMLVGREPSSAVRELDDRPGVTVTGTVPSMTPYLEESLVGVAPLRAGSGSRLKILESLAHGRPVVSTSLGLEGLDDLEGRGVVRVDDPASFAAALVALLRDPEAALDAGQLGKEAVEQSHLWGSTLEPLIQEVLRHTESA